MWHRSDDIRAFQVPDDAVHVWRARLDVPAAVVERLRPTLSPDEQDRAARFHFERDRRRFIVARGLLRTILGRVLDHAPETLCFRYGPYGKPALDPDVHPDDLQFNLSHTRDRALYAVARRRRIGVDVEWMHAFDALNAVARRTFSPRENADLDALPPADREAAFFRCWTRKEAYIKALGRGFSLPTDTFDVSLAPEAPPELLAVRHDAADGASWSLADVHPETGFAAALAVEGRAWHLACWDAPTE